MRTTPHASFPIKIRYIFSLGIIPPRYNPINQTPSKGKKPIVPESYEVPERSNESKEALMSIACPIHLS
jgi:hypothetical protein